MKNKKQRNAYIVVFSLVFCSCAYFNHEKIETKYPNGFTRTQYHFYKNEVDRKIIFFDSSGNKLDSANTLKNWCSKTPLNYLGVDTADCKNPETKFLNTQIDRCVDIISAKGYSLTYPFRKGYGHFIFWVSAPGKIEHSVCDKSIHLKSSYVQKFTQSMEDCDISQSKLDKPIIVSKKVIFEYR